MEAPTTLESGTPRASAPARKETGSADSFWGAFRDLPREHGWEPLRVEGTLPDELQGTLFRTGPALGSSFGQRYRHWFDGDGGVYGVRFAGGRAEGAARIVESRGLLEERRKGKRIFGGYGTKTPNVPRQVWDAFVHDKPGKNIANTSVLLWQGRLFCLMEAGKPTEIDPSTLRTIGETDLDGVVSRTFSAHPHWVPERRAHYNFGVRYGREALLDLYELPDEAPGRARKLGSIPLAGPTMIHDFAATKDHLIFFGPPLRFRMWHFMFGFGSYSDNLVWKPEEGTEILVVPIDAPERAIRMTVDPFYQWHFGHAFERGGEIFVDFVRYPDFSSNEWLRQIPRGTPALPMDGQLQRGVIDPKAKRVRFEQRWDGVCEFPVAATRSTTEPVRFTWAAAFTDRRAMPDHVAKIDVDAGTSTRLDLGPACFPSEPLFVPRAGATAEDDGFLVTLVYDALAEKSFVAVSDARTMAAPIAKAWFDHHLPYTFHGRWLPAGASGTPA